MKTRNFVSEKRNFVLKMMNFADMRKPELRRLNQALTIVREKEPLDL